MRNIRLVGLAVFLIASGFNAFAQQEVSGNIFDDKSAEAVFNVRIDVNGKGKAKTNVDGEFSFKLMPGDYVLTVSNALESYLSKDIEVKVIEGEDLKLNIEIGKDPGVVLIGSVLVVAKKKVGAVTTVAAADDKRSENSTTNEELPKETITQSGVADAAAAVQMVPGASVQEGKNVFIRGLGDRYTKTILNGMEIPGLDPDRNSVQMDIFPAVIIDNISVYKTLSPNLTADFTGGLIDIQTKNFPSGKTLFIKGSLSFNTKATFNSDFISYDGGKLDFLGFDDGTRGLPQLASSLSLDPNYTFPHPSSNDPLLSQVTGDFSKTMSSQKAFSFMNQNYAVAYGNKKDFKSKDSSVNRQYGYNYVLNYRNRNTYFTDVEYNEFLRSDTTSGRQLFRDRTSKGELATNDVLWTALIGQSLRVNSRNKLSVVLFHTQNGTSTASNLKERNFDSNPVTLVKHSVQYTQRSVSNINFGGLHYLDTLSDHKWKLNWNLAPTYSRISDPDIRSTTLEVAEDLGPNGEEQYLFTESVGSEVRRIFRSLNEYNISGKVDLTYKFSIWDSLESSLSFGALNTYKQRSFEVYNYGFRLYGTSNVVPNDPNWFFQDENLWSPETGQGVYLYGQPVEMANLYDANQNITSAYVMNELPIDSSFIITYGARMERNVNRYTGQDNNAATDPDAPRYDNEIVLNTLNVLPSINMVYKIRKASDSMSYKRKTNFRMSYSQTVARPSFREISISQIYDPIQGRRYLGNINLKQTLIHNADVRWEHFFGRTELVSASAFYKKFINPIEVVANVAAPNEFMPVNTAVADVYGVEFEIRKAIGFKAPSKEFMSFVVGTNFAYIVSLIDMNKVETSVGGVTMTEKEVRELNAGAGETIADYRPMYGQSPYVINAFATFKNDSLGLIINANYNVQGKKLAVIGIGSVPDVYEQPFHSLNMKISKTFGQIQKNEKGQLETTPRWQGSFTASNLLNNARQKMYESYSAENQTFEFFNPGMTFSLAFSYSIR